MSSIMGRRPKPTPEALLARHGGISGAELAAIVGGSVNACRDRLGRLEARGQAFSGKEGVYKVRRFFARKEDRDEWEKVRPLSVPEFALQMLDRLDGMPINTQMVCAANEHASPAVSTALSEMAKRRLVVGIKVGGINWYFRTTAELEAHGTRALEQRVAAACAARNYKAAGTKPGVDAGVVLAERNRAAWVEQEPDLKSAVYEIDTKVRPTARWQMLPDSGQSIFADRPSYGSRAA